MQIGLFALLTLVTITIALTGCRTSSRPSVADQREMLVASLGNLTKTVPELVDIFMTNRDWTESAPQAVVDAWEKAHIGGSTPVIMHMEQSQAAFQLIQLGPQAKSAAPAMIQSLADPDSSTRHWAIRVLQAIGPAAPEVVPALVRQLHNRNTGFEASQALTIISLSDTNVLPAVIAKLESDTESPEADYSVRVLEGIGAEARAAVPVLIRVLDNTNACNNAINTLCAIGPAAAPAVPHLLRLYRSDDSAYGQRKMIAIALGRIGPAAKEAVPMLKGLQHYEALDAARALWRIDPQYAQLAIDVARRELQATATPYRPDATSLLGEIGPQAQSVVPLLLQILDSPVNEESAFNAAWALWRIDPSQRAKLISVFENFRVRKMTYPYEDLPLDATGALWQIQPERRGELLPDVVAMLRNWKKDPTPAHNARPEMVPLLDALMDVAENPEYADLRPWAILAIRKIRGAGPEWWSR
jgi:HEAT repeat protein